MESRDELSQLRARLASDLSLADDQRFIRMVWALNALQTGRADVAGSYLAGVPADAATDGIHGPNAIYPWELETLVNEFLTTPKHPLYRTFECGRWSGCAGLVNKLRAVEGAEFGARRDVVNIWTELGRIGARQFPWQHGYFDIVQLYRSAFIYGQGECAAHLASRLDLTVADMMLVGFALRSVFETMPNIVRLDQLRSVGEFGLAPGALARVLDHIARPLSKLRSEAATLRAGDDTVAYAPSVLRRFPCVAAGVRNRTVYAPLPDLIMDRVTTGLFYDVIDGDGPIKAEIGRRFERYCLDLVTGSLGPAAFESEFPYSTKLGRIKSPDILMAMGDGAVRLAIECKAGRMNVGARFGEEPAGERGYAEIAKGVVQLWRFFAHCRQRVVDRELAHDARGMVLTLDEWFAGRSTIIPHIFERANALANASAHPIMPEDRRPVAFCTISELEYISATATGASFLETVERATGDQQGWMFSILHDQSKAPKSERKSYPFGDAIGQLLPWFPRIAMLGGGRS